ncbi:MAG TPA: MarR family transcriptional regulator [Caulobacteraceae bacterium]|nr:MarR family transcriptional regulator [Caulobacteraceae bacterium]
MAALNALLREVSGQGVLYSHAVASRLGISSSDLECLGYLANGPMTAGALAEATRLTTGAITGVVDRLERAGFAQRERDPSDRRKVLVRLEPTAFERAAPYFAPMERATRAALAGYADQDLALLLDFLTGSREAAAAAMAELQSLAEPAEAEELE